LRIIRLEDFDKLFETDPEAVEWLNSAYNAYIKIQRKSLAECKEKYPQYQQQILQCLCSLAGSMFFERKKKFNKLMEWFKRTSDYIEDHDFHELKEPNWRNPIALESYTWEYICNEFSKILKKDPLVKDKIIHDLQQQPFYDENLLAPIFEASLEGVWVSSEELSDALKIPIESLNRKADELIKEGFLTEEDFFKEGR